MPFLYHITDFDNLDIIQREGLKGDPVVYLAERPSYCERIREQQKKMFEKHREGSIIFRVEVGGYDLFDDPDTDAGAWMIYADLPPDRLALL